MTQRPRPISLDGSSIMREFHQLNPRNSTRDPEEFNQWVSDRVAPEIHNVFRRLLVPHTVAIEPITLRFRRNEVYPTILSGRIGTILGNEMPIVGIKTGFEELYPHLQSYFGPDQGFDATLEFTAGGVRHSRPQRLGGGCTSVMPNAYHIHIHPEV